MRILALETSSRRGSVALVEHGRVVARATHDVRNTHAEALRPLVDRVLAEAGWTKQGLDRIGVGVGPGSFTGLRVGMAFAQGIALGLGIPWLGVPSLWAMAHAAPPELPGTRVALLDARRDEVFVAAYAADGTEHWAATTLARARVREEVNARVEHALILGEVAAELGFGASHRSELTDLPDASGVALLAELRDPATSVREPLYVRDAGATPQTLPPSPLGG